MEISESTKKCQIQCLPKVSTGYGVVPPESILRRLRLLIRRSMNAQQVRRFKMRSGHFLERVGMLSRIGNPTSDTNTVAARIVSGDRVRVRSLEEILATLNQWGLLRGCMFMPEMEPYCGTIQWVLKPLERFVDERDYHLKKTSGVLLLEGLNCQGTSDYGRCDRHCFYFWREEWLEKIDTDAS